ncbi:MAG: nucleotide exchange factor GrpE [bacterium]
MNDTSDNELEDAPARDAAPTEPTAEPLEVSAEEIVIDPRDLEIASLKDRLLRLQADFDNFRKRTLRDRDDMARRAAEKILKELLPAIHHFELGIQAARNNHIKHSVIEGFEGIVKQFQAILERAGVTTIATKGQPFDPHSNECVTQIPSEEHPENIVIEETRRGYRLGNYILRAAQVIVSSGPAAVPPTNTP